MIQHTGWIGGPEIIIILVVVLLLFGGKKIPELAKGLGKGIRDFKKRLKIVISKKILKISHRNLMI